MREAAESVQTCTDRDLSAASPAVRGLPGDHQGYVWRFAFEVGEHTSVTYRVGLVRNGRRVSLLSVSPAQGYDVGPAGFAQLLERAGHRLGEMAEPDGSGDDGEPSTGGSAPEEKRRRR